MAGGKRGGAGERVLEGRHVIGLFCLMLLFSGVFFTLGYVMGKNQDDEPVRLAPHARFPGGEVTVPKVDARIKHPADPGKSPGAADGTTSPYPEWEFYHAGEPKKTEDHLRPPEPAPASRAFNTVAKSERRTSPANVRTLPNAPQFPRGAYVLQVAALRKESDALALAENLQMKKIPAFVVKPNGDKFYRVQVGPYSDPKSADTAKKGLETAGFRAIVKH